MCQSRQALTQASQKELLATKEGRLCLVTEHWSWQFVGQCVPSLDFLVLILEAVKPVFQPFSVGINPQRNSTYQANKTLIPVKARFFEGRQNILKSFLICRCNVLCLSKYLKRSGLPPLWSKYLSIGIQKPNNLWADFHFFVIDWIK